MKPHCCIAAICLLSTAIASKGQHASRHDSAETSRWQRSSAEFLLGLAGPFLLDRYVTREDYARISFSTVRYNLSPAHWAWDNDRFQTNQSNETHRNYWRLSSTPPSALTDWSPANVEDPDPCPPIIPHSAWNSTPACASMGPAAPIHSMTAITDYTEEYISCTETRAGPLILAAVPNSYFFHTRDYDYGHLSLSAPIASLRSLLSLTFIR